MRSLQTSSLGDLSRESPPARDEAAALLCELLRQFYGLGWCTGTGGGLSLRVADGYLVAPSGVAKERVRPQDLFHLDTEFEPRPDGIPAGDCRISECTPLFEAIYRRCDAGAVIHSHSIPLVLATRRTAGSRLGWEQLEMLKGIRGASYPQRHEIPIIENTPRESELRDTLDEALQHLPPNAQAVAVRHHGAYIWGRDAMEAKRHAEVYDWLCRFEQEEARGGLPPTRGN